MTTVTITNVNIDNPPVVGGYYVGLAWRYGTSGSFTGLIPSTFVNGDGTLLSPIDIVYDETINPIIQIRANYNSCSPSVNYYQLFDINNP